MSDAVTFEPIGWIRTSARYRFEAPRQAVFARREAFLAFRAGDFRFAQAVEDLGGFSHIWLLFCFHLNQTDRWRPKVRPPVSLDGRRYGVFATRSPHRPNPIGMSCVELLGVEKDGLRLGPCDLLDGTPVLDIKPYLPEVDSFPQARIGWRAGVSALKKWTVQFTETFLVKSHWIFQKTGLDAEDFCRIQLAYTPLDRKRKRIVRDDAHRTWIGFRTWQILFSVCADGQSVDVLDIRSHYSLEELNMPTDPYGDKMAHRSFQRLFPSDLS